MMRQKLWYSKIIIPVPDSNDWEEVFAIPVDADAQNNLSDPCMRVCLVFLNVNPGHMIL